MQAKHDELPTSPGALVEVYGLGVFLSGESGSGKSDLVLELLDRGHALIADDAVALHREGEHLHGYCPPPLRGLVAARGLGILDVAAHFGADRVRDRAVISLCIALQGQVSAPPLAEAWGSRTIMSVAVPCLELGPGRNRPLLVELAVRELSRRRQGMHTQAAFVAAQKKAVERKR